MLGLDLTKLINSRPKKEVKWGAYAIRKQGGVKYREDVGDVPGRKKGWGSSRQAKR